MNCIRIRLRYYSTASLSTSHFNQRITSLKNGSGPTKVNDALQLFDEMLLRQPPPSIIQFTQLISVIVKKKQYSTALILLDQMKLMGIPSNIYTINISINCHCRLNQVAYGFALLATIFKQGHPPSLATYTTLIHGLVLADRVFEAVELFKKLLRGKLCEPNHIMYGIIFNGLCKVGHTSKALELLRFMESGSCKPGVEQYSVVIDSLCKDKMVDHALELFAKMTEKGVLADVITYSSLIHGLCNFGRETEAAKMLRDMEEEGVSPSVDTFNILVNAFCKQGSVKDAELAVQAMVRRGLNPDVITYSALIDGYCLRGEIDDAEKVLDGMVKRDIVPNIITYNSLINGYCKKKQIDKARHLFQYIQDKGLIPDVVTYSSMLQGLCRSLFSEDREQPKPCYTNPLASAESKLVGKPE
ncbi:putative tetratricopeptide-like helical domain superfamily [Helianthus annuus]|nr:putative tetratricopeptide-like helical domain superfamily [Helianthus annuus]